MQFWKPDSSTRRDIRAHERWESCRSCPLHITRQRVCLWRGYWPAQLVFVGEAPGVAEDLFGYPFIGPAGQLLEEIIITTEKIANRKIPYLITNTVACLPVDGESSIRPPTENEQQACSPRLEEILRMANPLAVVAVGQEANNCLDRILDFTSPTHDYWKNVNPLRLTIRHPASILRSPEHEQGQATMRQVSALVNLYEDLLVHETQAN